MLKKSALKTGEKITVEGYTEAIELKMVHCSGCSSGFVLYDSRDQALERTWAPEKKQAKAKLRATHGILIGTPCSCGKGNYTLDHKEWEHYHKAKTLVKCECGDVVECLQFTNTCRCGRDFNFNGEILVPREQWGEETGEQWWDCL
ncbi:hypothetical protein [Bacillus sp. MMSF_3328]|uniref:hypothetical protein n=1 Tax=Bacillus sp. MMSF_3328 TaxID=3047080 RepID=UPI00273E0A1B|nr:hypothetical protein [Bacillus sp. MMSF_3328]